MSSYRLSGDEGVGLYEPDDIRTPEFERVAPALLDRLRACTGLTATVSDVLDELGWLTSVSCDVLEPRHPPVASVVGQVQTLAYLPSRRHVLHDGHRETPSRLAHLVLYRLARAGDVVVIDARAETPISVLGGLAASAGTRLGLAGVIVDGAVRDVDQIATAGLPVWSRSVTPRSGKSRMEAVSVNAPVHCGGVQVAPGDLAVADATGICFVPVALVEDVASRVLEVAAEESDAVDPGSKK
jgi:4-hydroxy-4-methyl-2-oxoglutarate aldolase